MYRIANNNRVGSFEVTLDMVVISLNPSCSVIIALRLSNQEQLR